MANLGVVFLTGLTTGGLSCMAVQGGLLASSLAHQAEKLTDEESAKALGVSAAAVRKYLAENPSKFDPRDYLKPAREAAKMVCRQRYLEFGCEGRAAGIKPVPLTEMARRYAGGELAQVVR